MCYNCQPTDGTAIATDLRYVTNFRKPTHQHQFTVPVEWEHTDYEEITSNNYGYFKPGTVTVTKLRCSGCTEEVERA